MDTNHIGACQFLTTGVYADCRCEQEEKRYLRLAKWSFGLFSFEVLGGFFSGSVALMSDGLHVLVDGTENIVSAVIARYARGNTNEQMLRKRGGQISASLLCGAGVWIVYEGFERIFDPHEVAWYMFIIATIGLGVNLYQRRLNNEAPAEHRNTQYFLQDLHLWSDISASIAVIIGGLVMMITEKWYWIDGALSVGIGAWIVLLALGRLFGLKVHNHNHGNGQSCKDDHNH